MPLADKEGKRRNELHSKNDVACNVLRGVRVREREREGERERERQREREKDRERERDWRNCLRQWGRDTLE